MNVDIFRNKQLRNVLDSLGIAERTFFVGGAVRDNLLNRPVKDFDLVVQKLNAEDVERISAAFPMVGKGFPVWLLDIDGETFELAATRIERSIGIGHTDFETNFIDVCLVDDLIRRDLTVNALARPVTDPDTLIDNFNGVSHLARGVLRHVSDAFIEDPLRVYRVARFASLYGFRISLDTFDLMRSMSELTRHLPGERVFEEIAKVLRTRDKDKIFRFFEILELTQNNHWFGDVDVVYLNRINDSHDPEVYFACLFQETNSEIVFPAEWVFLKEMFGNVRKALFDNDISRLFSLAVIVSRKRSERVEVNLLHLLNTEPNHAGKFRLFLDTVKHPLPQRLIDNFTGKDREAIWNIKEDWWRSILPKICY